MEFCNIEVKDTTALGAARVPEDYILSAVGPMAAEKLLDTDGQISDDSQFALNNLCESARHAGSVDYEVFKSALKKVNLAVLCSKCSHLKR